jgi:hypothetical protein
MDNEELFADLFAYRFALLDIYSDNEREIIVKLKLKLFALGHNRSAINRTIYEFYQHYSIPVTEIEIENSNIMIYPNLLFSTLMNIIDNTNDEDAVQEDIEVLTEEEFNNLEVIKIDKSNAPDVECECSICIDNISEGHEIIKLPCNHLFHYNCIKSHLTSYNNKCPLCRGNVINQ